MSSEDSEIIDKYISNDQQQVMVRDAPDPNLNLEGSFKCFVCGKVVDLENHSEKRILNHIILPCGKNGQKGYCSSRCFNKDIIPSTVHQTMDHQLLAQNIKQETQMWDLSVHVIIGLINKCIIEGEASYGDNFKISGIYKANDIVYEWLNEYNVLYHLLFVNVSWGDENRRFYMLQGKDADLDLVQQLSVKLSKDVSIDSYNVLQTVLSNLVDKITNERVRKLPIDAPKVKKFIVDVPNVFESLRRLGFKETTVDGREMLVWPLSENLENVRSLLSKVKILACGGKLFGDESKGSFDPIYTYGADTSMSRETGKEPPLTRRRISVTPPSDTKSTTQKTEDKNSAIESTVLSLRDRAKQIQLEKEIEEKKREREREKRRVLHGKQAMQAKLEIEEKQKELKAAIEKERKKREKEQDKEAKRRLKEQLRLEREERLAEKNKKNP